jgi:leucyl aminopeptidase
MSAARYAGMLVAGTYLREFVADGVAWAHIDIAGLAYNTAARGATLARAVPGTDPHDVRGAQDIAQNG